MLFLCDVVMVEVVACLHVVIYSRALLCGDVTTLCPDPCLCAASSGSSVTSRIGTASGECMNLYQLTGRGINFYHFIPVQHDSYFTLFSASRVRGPSLYRAVSRRETKRDAGRRQYN